MYLYELKTVFTIHQQQFCYSVCAQWHEDKLANEPNAGSNWFFQNPQDNFHIDFQAHEKQRDE